MSDESSMRPQPQRMRADGVASLEELMRRLPAERRPPQTAASSAEASTIWEPEERDFLQLAAQAMAIRLEDLVLAGFAGMLSRLSLAGDDLCPLPFSAHLSGHLLMGRGRFPSLRARNNAVRRVFPG